MEQSRIFEFFTSAHLVYGARAVDRLPALVSPLGKRVFLVRGRRRADVSRVAQTLESTLSVVAAHQCVGEPTVEDVDQAAAEARRLGCDVVVAVGGGSVMDCGKAVAGMVPHQGSVGDYLEGVGSGRSLERDPLPFVAVPTTAGTGSEVTKNAVLTTGGHKKSFRSVQLLARVAVVDPLLTFTLPPEVTAASGMDAVTQLIEAALSKGAQPLTDVLAWEGLRAARGSLVQAFHQPDHEPARAAMSWASLLSGLCLANAGLGAVHGLAAPLGAVAHIPHGQACAALVPHVWRVNWEVARMSEAEGRLAPRVIRVAEAVTGHHQQSAAEASESVGDWLRSLVAQLQLPPLRSLGLRPEQIPVIVAGARGSSMSYNPVSLTDEHLRLILERAW